MQLVYMFQHMPQRDSIVLVFPQAKQSGRLVKVYPEKFVCFFTGTFVRFDAADLPPSFFHHRKKSTNAGANVQKPAFPLCITYDKGRFLAKGNAAHPLVQLVEQSLAGIGVGNVVRRCIIRTDGIFIRYILRKTQRALAALPYNILFLADLMIFYRQQRIDAGAVAHRAM